MQTARPTISLVTPNFNLAATLETTLRSVLDQHYPRLDYVVVDGGSTDGSVDIIRRHANRLSSWTSEPDGGLYDSLNKGFARTTGEIMGWINSDDMHLPWTLSVVAEIFETLPQVQWITSLHPLVLNEKGQAAGCPYAGGFNRADFMRGGNLPRPDQFGRVWIQQESTFWRRSLWDAVGGRVDGGVVTGGDFELWSRFFQHADLYGVGVPLAGFRHRANQNSAAMRDRYLAVAEAALQRQGGKRYGRWTQAWRKRAWNAFGRRPLARAWPGWLLQGLSAAGVLLPVPTIRHRRGGWRVEQDYIL